MKKPGWVSKISLGIDNGDGQKVIGIARRPRYQWRGNVADFGGALREINANLDTLDRK